LVSTPAPDVVVAVVVAPGTLAVADGDVPVLVLVVCVLVLCITTAVMALNLPTRRWPRHGWVIERRQQHRRAHDRAVTHRDPLASLDAGARSDVQPTLDGGPTIHVTGRDRDVEPFVLPAALAAPTPPPAATMAPLDEAETVITELLDTDPELLARLMSEWIREDERDGYRS